MTICSKIWKFQILDPFWPIFQPLMTIFIFFKEFEISSKFRFQRYMIWLSWVKLDFLDFSGFLDPENPKNRSKWPKTWKYRKTLIHFVISTQKVLLGGLTKPDRQFWDISAIFDWKTTKSQGYLRAKMAEFFFIAFFCELSDSESKNFFLKISENFSKIFGSFNRCLGPSLRSNNFWTRLFFYKRSSATFQ
jgi:hypothetical protein